VTTGTVVAGLPRTPANQLSRSDATCVQHEKPRTWLRDEAALQWLECVSVRDLGVVAQLRELQDALNRNGYHKYCVWGHQALDATEQNIAEYCACLDRADSEKPLQEFLEAQPLLLTAEEGSQCRCVVPRKSLGGMFVPDFLVGRLHSPTFYGSQWNSRAPEHSFSRSATGLLISYGKESNRSFDGDGG
jgi:hypothetical protein